MSHLTTAQLQLIKAAIIADPALSAKPQNSDGAFEIAVELNKPATPAFVVWKLSVTAKEMGEAMNSTEVSGLTTANTNRLMVMHAYSGDVFNPSRLDTRTGFDSVFSGTGGALTRAALLTLYKRNATRFEKVLATGTGTDLSPANMAVESPVDYTHILDARAS